MKNPNLEKKDYLFYFLWKFRARFENKNICDISGEDMDQFVDDFVQGKVQFDKTLLSLPVPESILKIFAPKEIDDDKKLF